MIDSSRDHELNDALELFFFGYREFTAYPDALLATRGLARMHHRILYFVGRTPGIAVSELLRTLGITKQALNAPLRRLVELGLVSAAPGQSDRRTRELRLTADGIVLESDLSGSQRSRMAEVFASAGPAAEAGWRSVMRELAPGPD